MTDTQVMAALEPTQDGRLVTRGLCTEKDAARFWVKVDRRGPDDCWHWTAKEIARGYGRFWFRNGLVQSHRFAYELAHGIIPPDLVIDHLCRNKLCLNPAHMEPVTIRENTMRGIAPSARNATKTHCKRGHPFSGDNLKLEERFIHGSWKTHRVCRECRRGIDAKRRAK